MQLTQIKYLFKLHFHGMFIPVGLFLHLQMCSKWNFDRDSGQMCAPIRVNVSMNRTKLNLTVTFIMRVLAHQGCKFSVTIHPRDS